MGHQHIQDHFEQRDIIPINKSVGGHKTSLGPQLTEVCNISVSNISL